MTNYTIEQLLAMDFFDKSETELKNIDTYITAHYNEDPRYTELLEEVRFALEIA